MVTVNSTNTYIVPTTAREVTQPSQPAFLATHTVDQINVTGTGGFATVNYTTEIYDQNADYNATNTFTAPVTGRYFLHMSLYISGFAVGNEVVCGIQTSNRGYYSNYIGVSARTASDALGLQCSTLADMDAGDTCVATCAVSGAGLAVDYLNFPERTWFCGFLSV